MVFEKSTERIYLMTKILELPDTKQETNTLDQRNWDQYYVKRLKDLEAFPVKLQQFAEEHGCENAEEIAKVIGPIFDDIIGLQCLTGFQFALANPADSKVREPELTSLLQNTIGGKISGIKMVSLSSDEFMLPDMLHLLHRDLDDLVRIVEQETFYGLKSLFGEIPNDLEVAIKMAMLNNAAQGNLDAEIIEGIFRNYWNIILNYIGYFLADKPEKAKLLQGLTKFLTEGYIPFGLDIYGPSREFYVFVA